MNSASRDATNALAAIGIRRNGVAIAAAMVLILFSVMDTTHTDVVLEATGSVDIIAGQPKATPAATTSVSDIQASHNGGVAVAQSTVGIPESTNAGGSSRYFAVGGHGLLMAMAASGFGLLLALVAASVSAATVLRRKLFSTLRAVGLAQ
ncbi:MAG: hypothetical protein WD360_06180 [Nitriliruptoraceae bacterium]